MTPGGSAISSLKSDRLVHCAVRPYSHFVCAPAVSSLPKTRDPRKNCGPGQMVESRSL
jgi:hypothetical protein